MKHFFTFCLLVFSVARLSAQMPLMILEDSWNVDSIAWESHARTTNTFNPDSTLASALDENYQNQSWENDQWTEYTYDLDHYLLSFEQFMWNAPSSSWESEYLYSYTYDANHVLTGHTAEHWFSGNLDPVYQVHYTYDAVTENLSYEIMQVWDNWANQWEDDLKIEYTYDAAGNQTSQISYTWDDVLSQWEPNVRNLYTFTAFNKELTYQLDIYENGDWRHLIQHSSTFDANEVLIYKFSESWDIQTSSWNNSGENYYYYNTDASLHQRIYKTWNATDSVFVNLSRYTYIYPGEMGVEEQEAMAMHVYPNPVADQLNLAFEKEIPATVVVTDLSGNVLKSQSGAGALQTVSVDDLPAGVYVVSVMTEGKVAVRKIVKQ